MDISVSITHPDILCAQALGTVLVCHQPSLAELVLMRVAPLVELPGLPNPDELVTVVVLCSKVAADSRGHFPVGRLLQVVGDAPVTPLKQVESAAFRAAEPEPSSPHPSTDSAVAAVPPPIKE